MTTTLPHSSALAFPLADLQDLTILPVRLLLLRLPVHPVLTAPASSGVLGSTEAPEAPEAPAVPEDIGAITDVGEATTMVDSVGEA